MQVKPNSIVLLLKRVLLSQGSISYCGRGIKKSGWISHRREAVPLREAQKPPP